MVEKIEWKEPVEITQRDIQDKVMPELRSMVRRLSVIILILCIPLVPLCLLLGGVRTLWTLAVLPLLLYQVPFLIWTKIKRAHRFGVTNEVTTMGVRINGTLYHWTRLESYKFSDSECLQHVRNLNLKIRNYDTWKVLPFFDHDIDENQLQALLEKYIFKTTVLAKSPGVAQSEINIMKTVTSLRKMAVLSFITGIGFTLFVIRATSFTRHDYLVGALSIFLLIFPLFFLLFLMDIVRFFRLKK